MKIMMMVLRMNNAHDADEDDNEYKVDLMRKVFQNTEDNLIEFVYTKNSTGRDVLVDCRLKAHLLNDKK